MQAEEDDTLEREHNLPTIRDVNLLYFIPMALFFITDEIATNIKITVGSYGSRMLLISLLEIIFILVPIAILAYFKKWDVKHLFRLNKIKLDNMVLSAVIMLFAIPVTAFINAIVIFILFFLGKVHAQPMFPSENLLQLIVTLFVVAVTPAVVEELLCRGVILRGYEKWGIRASLLMSSLLFALLHRDIQSLVGTFLLGLLIAYIVYRTNSIFAGMIAHFTNNGFIVVMTFLSTMLTKRLENRISIPEKTVKVPDLSNLSSIPTEQLIMVLIFSVVFVFFCGTVLIGLLWLLKYNTKNINREVTEVSAEKTGKTGSGLLYISFMLVLFRYFQELGVVSTLTP